MNRYDCRCRQGRAAYPSPMRTTMPPPSETVTEPENLPVMAYVPLQVFGQLYAPETAMEIGTLFPALNKPLVGIGGMCCE